MVDDLTGVTFPPVICFAVGSVHVTVAVSASSVNVFVISKGQYVNTVLVSKSQKNGSTLFKGASSFAVAFAS
eukprot:UN11409